MPQPLTGHRGLTLVELMIGMALSLLVILAVTYVFAASRASYRHQESFSAVQETGRIALEVLTRDIRMAGYPGCGNLLFMNHLSSGNALPADARFGNEFAINGAVDRVTIVRGSAENALLVASPSANEIQADNLALLGTVSVGDRLLLSDCVFTEVLTVAAVAGNVVTTAANLQRQYRPSSRVMRLEQVNFSLSPQNELLRNGQPIAAGVETLRFQYGLSAAGARSVTNYLEPPGAPSPPPPITAQQAQSVVAVRVLMEVTDGGVNDMLFSSTITLRNRAP